MDREDACVGKTSHHDMEAGFDLAGKDLPQGAERIPFPTIRSDAEMHTSMHPIRERKIDNIHRPKVSYNFDHPRRGFAVIINQEHFHRSTNQSHREGTEVDAEMLVRLFLKLGFDVGRYDDLTAMEMRKLVTDLAKGDYSQCDCFVLVILSHGMRGRVYGYDHAVSLSVLLSPFKGDNCPTLKGKPKLFFIQACRGARYMHGVEIPAIEEGEDEPDSGKDETDATGARTIPSEADVFIAYSVVPGFFAWRNNVDGSWFIRALSTVLTECSATMELMEMMTYVNRIVAYDYESATDSDFTDGMKQVPSIISRLTKSLYFTKKTVPEEYNVYSHYPSQFAK